MSAKRKERRGWYVLAQKGSRRPRKITYCPGGEDEARRLVRALNLAAVNVTGRPLYWCEYMDTSS